MPFPKQFFYQQKNAEVYGLEPPGELNIKRMLKRQPFWKKPRLSGQEHQKALILSDWRAQHWSNAQRQTIEKTLNRLITSGFALYWGDKNGLTPLTDLNNLSKYYDNRLALPEALAKHAFRQYELLPEEIFILDDYWLQVLETDEEAVRFVDSAIFNRNTQQKKVLALLQQAKPPLQKIEHTEFSKFGNHAILELRRAFPEAALSPAYRTLQLDQQWLETLLQEGHIIHQRACFPLDDLDQIEQFEGNNLAGEALPQLLLRMKNLRALRLSYCQLPDDLSDCLDISFLEVLEVGDTQLTGQNLNNLLKKFSHLKILKLENCIIISDDLSDDLDLPHLESLDVSNTSLTNESLRKLLKKCFNIKTLNLSGYEEILDNLGDLEFPLLESLNVGDTSLTDEGLKKLLQKCPNLKTLDLSYCKKISDDCIDDLNLPLLESLNVSSTSLTDAGLKKLLKKCPNLKTINFYSCEKISDNLSDGLELPLLESLDVGNTSLSDEGLRKLLKKCPNLKKLELAYCKKISDDWINDLELPLLESLDVSNTSLITHEGLKKLLKKCPNLKILDLSYCKKISDDWINDLEVPLPNLESLDIGGASLTDQGLSQLSKKYPNLKTLRLYNCKKISGNNLSADLNLSCLESLDVSYSSLSSEGLKKLLRRMPKLKTLDMNNCKIQIDAELQSLLDEIPNVMMDDDSADSELAPTNDPVFNPSSMTDFKPTPDNFDFQFAGRNKSLNQAMIIEKLSQYLTLTHQQQALIPKIQDGICTALVHLFLSEPDFLQWIKEISNWDGYQDTLKTSRLPALFDTLIEYLNTYQFGNRPREISYLGDNLDFFLNNLTPSDARVFTNPWHAIAIKYDLVTKHWLVYDPNSFQGAKECDQRELASLITHRLGPVISVEGPSKVPPKINDLSNFIEHGGLLTLCQVDHHQELLEHLKKHPLSSLKPEAFAGLLLCNTKGIPAWVVALKNPPTKNYILDLLSAFAQKKDCIPQLKNSITALSPHERHECLVALQGLASPYQDLVNALSEPLRNAPANHYEQKLQTWRKTTPQSTSLKAYCQSVLQAEKPRQLLELDSMESVLAMHYILEGDTSRPVFYIDSPDDLVCSAPFVSKKGQQGKLVPGPGGPLYDFLEKNKDKAPVLIVNYAHFDADDIVRFNGLLDKKRHADGTPLPDNALVVGLMNTNKTDCYQGEDFYSRFDAVSSCPFNETQLVQEKAPLPLVAQAHASTRIHLYHAADWKERLLGQWVIHQDQLVYEEGLLQPALQKGHILEIHQGLWTDPQFQHFWQHAVLRGYIEYEGERLMLPKDLQLVCCEKYDWASLKQHFHGVDAVSPAAPVLNPSLLADFFRRYHCDTQQHTLDTLAGLIKQQAHKSLEVYLTRALSEDEWAMLLQECQAHDVHLKCCCAPAVILPEPLQPQNKPPQAPAALPLWDVAQKESTLILESSDPDTTISLLTQGEKDWQVIDVSECQGSDLLTQLRGELKDLKLVFTQSTNALLEALDKKQNILLKGQFALELVDALAPLLRQRQNTPQPSRLVCVSQDTSSLHFLARQKHEVEVLHKRTALLAEFFTAAELDKLPQELWAQESLSRLRARLIHQRIYPESNNTDAAWQGLYHLPGTIILGDFQPQRSKQLAQDCNQQRLDAVNKVLAHAPFVFLTGLTGVGKSTFVEKMLGTPETLLYHGVAQLKAWAQDDSKKRKILFIDEANLSKKQWSEFEGLFNTPPGILIDGHYYPLSPEHKVVFAGNPLHYGDERTLAPFFEHHGNALVFDPLPLELIYEDILKPVFGPYPLPVKHEVLCQPFLEVYRFLCGHSENKVLISPRELQMMALSVLSYAKQQPNPNYLLAAQSYAYQLARPLLPPVHHQAFDAQFKPQKSLPHPACKTSPKFILTPSREPIYQQIEDLLALRQLRQSLIEEEKEANEAQLYGGLGGLILEGVPGIGKSELVMAALLAHGFTQVRDFSTHPDKKLPPKPFYHMSVSMGLEEKKQLLLTAFHEGAVVLIDEINSSPMMEDLLNDLLMGKTADKKRPIKPGFMIIGTQNPPSMSGRRQLSPALARRFILMQVPPYTTEEMVQILVIKGLELQKSRVLVHAYENCLQKAQKESLTPAPTFRDLEKLALYTLQENREELLDLPDGVLQILEQLAQKNQEASKMFSTLYQHIDTLQVHGKKIGGVDGNNAKDYAQQLKKLAGEYMISLLPHALSNKGQIREHFSNTLAQAQNTMKSHRKVWRPILANIAIAATGIGLLALVAKFLTTGQAFFAETKRQKIIKEIENLNTNLLKNEPPLLTA